MRVVRRWSLVLCGAAAIGCAGAEPVTPAPASRQGELAAERPSRGKIIGGEKVARRVQWPAQPDAQLVARLTPQLRADVDAAPLPVLLPTTVGLDGAKLMRGADWYALWLSRDGLTITLNASGTARIHPHIRGADLPHTVRGARALVTQNESVWSASWVEHGVAYDLGLECADPTMEACRDDSLVRQLAEGLGFAGGRP